MTVRACLFAAGLFVTLAFSAHASVTAPVPLNSKATMTDPTALSAKQAAIPLIAAAMATSDIPHLRTALTEGLDAGLTISEAKEILVHLYVYAGFPMQAGAIVRLD